MRFLKCLALFGLIATFALPALAGPGERHKQVFIHADDDDSEHGFLGVYLDGDNDDDGARVIGIIDDTGAEAAGLEDGDLIVGLNGNEIRSTRDLSRQMRNLQPGDRVDVEVLRDGERQSFTAELGENPHHYAFDWHDDGDHSFTFDFDVEGLQEHLQEMGEHLEDMDFEELGRNFSFQFSRSSKPVLGVQVVQPTAELRQFVGGPDDAGVLIGKVLPDTPAEQAGLQVGDLIVALDDKEIEDADDLIRALRHTQGQTIALELVRDGRTITVDAFIPEREEEEPDYDRGRKSRKLSGGTYRQSRS